jgi:ankyrin repeat protein
MRILVAVFAVLLACGNAAADTPNSPTTTSLHVASEDCDTTVVETLLARAGAAGANVRSSNGATPLLVASCADAAEALISAGADVESKGPYGVTPLLVASQNGLVDVVRTLIDAGADVDAPTQDADKTPLHVAAARGHTAVVEALLAAGARVNPVNRAGYTPFIGALLNKQPLTAKVLYRAGGRQFIDGEPARETKIVTETGKVLDLDEVFA